MIEIHEPVRLQIVIEARTEIIGAIYGRQAGLRELIGNNWVHVIAKDPDSGEFSIFDPARGFVPWARSSARFRAVGRTDAPATGARPFRRLVPGAD